MAVESGLESLLRSEGDAAAERAEASWQAHAAGRRLIESSDLDLSRSSPEFERGAARAIRDWQGAVLDLVADEGMSKRSKARFMALGVNGVGVALMIVVFAHTGGLVGAEVGVAGGTAVLAQRVLEAVFGDQAIRRLAETAKDDLDARVQTLLASELLRYHAILDARPCSPNRRSGPACCGGRRVGSLRWSSGDDHRRPGARISRGAEGDRGADSEPDPCHGSEFLRRRDRSRTRRALQSDGEWR